jgi:hypothetical protein
MNETPLEAYLADSLVAAAAAARRFEARRRVAGRALIVSALLGLAVLAVRLGTRPSLVYVIRGDSTGVVMTGPDVARRTECTPARPSRKGDRT